MGRREDKTAGDEDAPPTILLELDDGALNSCEWLPLALVYCHGTAVTSQKTGPPVVSIGSVPTFDLP
jgi:hypothetical protein